LRLWGRPFGGKKKIVSPLSGGGEFATRGGAGDLPRIEGLLMLLSQEGNQAVKIFYGGRTGAGIGLAAEKRRRRDRFPEVERGDQCVGPGYQRLGGLPSLSRGWGETYLQGTGLFRGPRCSPGWGSTAAGPRSNFSFGLLFPWGRVGMGPTPVLKNNAGAGDHWRGPPATLPRGDSPRGAAPGTGVKIGRTHQSVAPRSPNTARKIFRRGGPSAFPENGGKWESAFGAAEIKGRADRTTLVLREPIAWGCG